VQTYIPETLPATFQAFKEKYPLLFSKHEDLDGLPDGWQDLFISTLQVIGMWQWLDKARGFSANKLEYITIEQIKEKFGELRIYWRLHTTPHNYVEQDIGSEVTNTIEGIVDFAGHMSKQTCQVCGNRGKLQCQNGWYVVLCDEHDS
jgi:hypothetical protein